MAAHRSVVCLGILSGFLAVLCLALAGILVWREYFNDVSTTKGDPALVSLNTTNVTEVQTKFPGYFRTEEEQERLQLANQDLLTPRPVVNVSKVFRQCFTNQYCDRLSYENITTTVTTTTQASKPDQGAGARRRRKRQVTFSSFCSLDVYDKDELTFHGCCVSYSELQKPKTMPTAEPGQSGNVVIAQFSQLKQYFEIQQCCQALSCTGCQCAQTHYVTSAVIEKRVGAATLYKTEFVRVPGCCKCLNTVPQNELY